MTFTPLKIEGVWLHAPKVWTDERGAFHEVFKLSTISSQLGHEFHVKQTNQSNSKAGVVRGIHWTDSPEGQAKYISCPKGALWDVVVDLRPNSRTYGQWDARFLTEENHASLLISEGIGHGFLTLKEDTVANYLCTSEYSPTSEKTINPLSSSLAIPFEDTASQFHIDKLIFSNRDEEADEFRF